MQFRPLVPKSGWIRKYVAYAMGSTSHEPLDKYLNEIPIEFHLFTGLTILGAALRRNIWLPRGVYNIYPAMTTILAAPTGMCRKTTAINIGAAILRTSGVTKIISEKITPEALIRALKQEKPALRTIHKKEGTEAKIIPEYLDSTGIVIAPELSVFLSQADYMKDLVPILTRLADCPDYFPTETICRDITELRNVALSELSGTAPAWLLGGGIRGVIWGGGFMARRLFICRYRPTTPVSNPALLCSTLKDELVKELMEISKRRGPLPLSAEGLMWMNQWYISFYPKKSREEKRAAYHERKDDHLLRLALILAASRSKVRVDLEDLNEALSLLDTLEESMFQLFGTIERTSTEVGFALDKVLKRVKARGRISHTKLLQSLTGQGLRRDEIHEAITTCEENKWIKKEVEMPSKISRSKIGPKFYRYIGGEDRDDVVEG